MSIIEDFQTGATNTTQGGAGDIMPASFDPARYKAEVDRFDISDAQAQALLATLWSIMSSFVDLGFRADVCAMMFQGNDAIPTDDERG